MAWLIISFLFAVYSMFTGASVLFDPSCNMVEFGGSGRNIVLTCYPDGVAGGDMTGEWAGGIAIVIGLMSLAAGVLFFAYSRGYTIDDVIDGAFFRELSNNMHNGKTNNTSVKKEFDLYDYEHNKPKHTPPPSKLEIASNSSTSPEELERLSTDKSLPVIIAVASNTNISDETTIFLSSHKEIVVRTAIANNPSIPLYLLEELLASEKTDSIRKILSFRIAEKVEAALLLKRQALIHEAAQKESERKSKYRKYTIGFIITAIVTTSIINPNLIKDFAIPSCFEGRSFFQEGNGYLSQMCGQDKIIINKSADYYLDKAKEECIRYNNNYKSKARHEHTMNLYNNTGSMFDDSSVSFLYAFVTEYCNTVNPKYPYKVSDF